jgi:S1-C subfamily serine protease
MAMTRARMIILVLAIGLLGLAGVFVSGALPRTATTSVLFDEEAVVALYQRSSPAVVEVNVIQPVSFRGLFTIPQWGLGSGFLVDTAGHILTNYHVVRDAAWVRVTLSDGRILDATVIGTSPADDLALLKVDPQAVEAITPLPLGDSTAARPGQLAIALGSPFGLDSSITLGVVSGVNRSRLGLLGRPITGMLQTDAAINPGNSGGPLLNSRGEAIGVNTAIEASKNGGVTGIGFAVPINTAQEMLVRLTESPAAERP